MGIGLAKWAFSTWTLHIGTLAEVREENVDQFKLDITVCFVSSFVLQKDTNLILSQGLRYGIQGSRLDHSIFYGHAGQLSWIVYQLFDIVRIFGEAKERPSSWGSS